jgi:hypothetical protein
VQGISPLSLYGLLMFQFGKLKSELQGVAALCGHTIFKGIVVFRDCLVSLVDFFWCGQTT